MKLKTKEYQLRASRNYIKKNITQLNFMMNRGNDKEQEIIDFLSGKGKKERLIALYEFWKASTDE